MLVKILAVIAIILITFLVVASMQPDHFKVSRSTVISAPAAAVFPHVNNFHGWEAWSPWAKMDPKAVNTFTGPDAGTGAQFHWAGNNDVGEGRMTIADSSPDKYININIEFIKPFQAVNTVEFTFTPKGNQTEVVWSMFGKNTLIGKAMSLVMNCDKMIGDQYEKGLANLKAVAEKTAK